MGRVVSWSRPLKQNNHWTSEIELVESDGGNNNDSQKNTKKVCLKTRSAEEHVWITEPVGSWVLQVPESGGQALLQTAVPSSSTIPPYHFFNVDVPMKIVGVITKGHTHEQRTVILECMTSPPTVTRQPVVCTDLKLWSELVRIGIGSWIKLYNVITMEPNGDSTVILTEKSGIRQVSIPHPSKESSLPVSSPVSSQEVNVVMKKKKKWECLNCGSLNFISKSVCKRCDCNRRDGPLPADWVPRKVKQPWKCRHCHFETNFFDNQSCWKCGRPRRQKKNFKK